MLKRVMFQLYLSGCDQAIAFYEQAFGAVVRSVERNPEDDSIIHAEIEAFGQIIALSERREPASIGNTMQFCFHFDRNSEEVVRKVYETLHEGADVHSPLGPTFFSPCSFGLVDRFGVDWCFFIT